MISWGKVTVVLFGLLVPRIARSILEIAIGYDII